MLFKPKYLAGSFLVIVIAVSCFLLSSWQFSRLSERKELNKKISSRMKTEAVDISTLAKADEESFINKYEYKRVKLEGKFVNKGTVLILGRSLDGDPGYNMMALLETKDMKLIYVNVGFLSTTLGEALSDGNATEKEAFTKLGDGKNYSFTALIRKNETKGLFGSDMEVKKGKTTNRIDVKLFLTLVGDSKNRLEKEYWVQLLKFDGEKNVDKYPDPIATPELSEKNHLSYAIQWIFFGFTAIITWCVICFKASKRNRRLHSANIEK